MTILNEAKHHLNLFTNNRDTVFKIDKLLRAKRLNSEHEPRVQMGKDDGYTRFYQAQNYKDGKYFKVEKGFKERLIENIEFDKVELLPPLERDDAIDFLKSVIPTLPFTPYKHQLKGFLSLIRSRNKLDIIATGGGKSMVAYLVLKYFFDHDIPTILVVPTIGLTSQMFQDFKDYNAPKEMLDSIKLIGGENDDKALDKPYIITTWQSLNKVMKDVRLYDAILVDECLRGDTLIKTINGDVPIDSITEGDLVMTYNETTKQNEYNQVLKTHKNISNEQMYEIETDNGKLYITGNHKVFTQRGYVRVDELVLTDELLPYK